MSTDLLSVRDLSVDFLSERGPVRVLDQVNFSIGRGEVVGLVGESGCGKSTLARAILGVLPRHSARVRSGLVIFDGKNLLEMPPEQLRQRFRGRRITMIPQDPYRAFNPLFSVGAQILDLMRWKSPLAENGPARSRAQRDRDLVIETLRTIQIPAPEQALGRLPHEFSGGQLQRLMIAMAFLPKPELIIADEPTTALDVTIQAEILRLLRRMVDLEHTSVIFTTHDLATAYQLCDRIVVMYAGQEVEVSATEEFFVRARHPYSLGLLASIPGETVDLRGIPGEIPNLVDPPSGCRFHPRCDRAIQLCAGSRPGSHLVTTSHNVRCFNPAGVRVDA